MNEKLGHEGRYTFEVSKEKNRIYLTPEGKWKTPEDIPDYLEHMKNAISMVKKGFTIIVNVSKMANPALGVTKLLKEGQNMCIEAGLRRSATIVPKDQLVKTMSLKVVARFSGLKDREKVFPTIEEAEEWLDKE